MDKAAIVAAMRARHGELEETLRLLSEKQMLEPVFDDERSELVVGEGHRGPR